MGVDPTFHNDSHQWGQAVAELRYRRGLTQAEVAAEVGVTTRTVSRWERGIQAIRVRHEVALAAALGVTLDGLRHAANHHSVDEQPEMAVVACPVAMPELGDYLTDDDISAARRAMSCLLTVENSAGAAQVLGPAVQLLGVLRHRLQVGAVAPAVERDLCATVGELAEIIGWFAFDAEQQGLVAEMNLEALHWSRLAGDRVVELLTIQNASMHAGHLGHHNQSLLYARSVLATSGLTPRLRALFHIREARALAARGDWAGLAALDAARALWEDGTSSADPPWAWWVNERELAWHDAMCRRDLRQASRAVESFEQALDAAGPHEKRKELSHRAYLLQGQIEAGAWAEVDATVDALVPLKSLGSKRTLLVLSQAVAAAPQIPALARLAHALRSTTPTPPGQ